MYTLALTCIYCGSVAHFERQELWYIVALANELEIHILSNKAICDQCETKGPMHIAVYDEAKIPAFFEKIISPIDNITNSNTSYHIPKPTMDEPCLMCCATGKLEIQYKAHKKKNSLKGVLTEQCPICDGKGYFK